MGLCSLTHQIDALTILNELQAHATTSNRDGEGQCEGDLMKEPRRLKTIAERARESFLTRLLEILTRLISIEEDFIKDVSSLLKHKVRCFFDDCKVYDVTTQIVTTVTLIPNRVCIL